MGAYVRKMDDEGNLLWDTLFNANTINGTYPTVFYKIQFTENDLFIAAGEGGIYFNDSNYHSAPYLVIFDLNGTVLSNRGYTSFFNGPSSAWFEDIRPTKDGGYIAGGQYHPTAGDTGKQDMFVLKLDGAGCEYPGCQPPLSVAELKASKALGVSAYPNPFNTGITFDVGQAEVDEIIITDIRGVLVDRIIMEDKQSKATWNSGKMAAGVYIAKISSSTGALSLKVIKY